MFPFPIAKPQGCDIQTFYGAGNNNQQYTWNKPVGVSHVYMMLIGGGGTGNTVAGGGSGAVTVWYGAAQHVPSSLIVRPSGVGVLGPSYIYYARVLTSNVLLQANSANGATQGGAVSGGPFAASGFFKSTAGQDGTSGGPVSPSSTTFLSGGSDAIGNTGNYGYDNFRYNAGFFQMQPIIVGVGSANSAGTPGVSGIGCGGGASSDYPGGPGMVLIASW